MEPIGNQLKKIRESKNISFEQLKEGTKLQEKVLRAIEDNQFDTINPVYLRGFLKIYCKFLGLDPNNFIPQPRKSEVQEMEPIKLQHREIPKFKKDKPKEEQEKQKKRVDFNPKWIKLIFAIPLIIIIGLFLARPKNIVKPKEKTSFLQQKNKAKQRSQGNSTPIKTKQLDKTTNTSFAIKGSLSLTIHAKQNSWLRIKSDGRTVFQNVLQKGNTEVWVAKEKLELAVGNAGGLELQLNGRILPSLGSRGQVIKKILITKDGIDINK
ncbi:MAG: RodZ domain-containing protein [Candidatus Omnitrophota bacterium]